MRNALINTFDLPQYRVDHGALWENFVIAEYAKKNLIEGSREQLYYWRTKEGSEVDLVVKRGQMITAFEIKSSPSAPPRFTCNKSFTNRYGVPVMLISPQTFLEHLI